MRITIGFNPPIEDKIASFQRLAATGIYEGIGRLGQEVDGILLQALKDEAPKRTGAYAGGIYSAQHGGVGSLSFEYRAADPLSKFIIEGTAAHDIYPTKGRALVFLSASGQLVFTAHVHHPGTKPNDYPARAWSNVKGDVLDILSRTGRELLDSVQ